MFGLILDQMVYKDQLQTLVGKQLVASVNMICISLSLSIHIPITIESVDGPVLSFDGCFRLHFRLYFV